MHRHTGILNFQELHWLKNVSKYCNHSEQILVCRYITDNIQLDLGQMFIVIHMWELVHYNIPASTYLQNVASVAAIKCAVAPTPAQITAFLLHDR